MFYSRILMYRIFLLTSVTFFNTKLYNFFLLKERLIGPDLKPSQWQAHRKSLQSKRLIVT